MNIITEPKIVRLDASEKISFGPDASYQPLLADGDTPIFLGIQTSEPGYETEPHSHPYVETLFVLEGEAELWLVGHEDEATRLQAGDCAALPPNRPHGFRVVGGRPLRTLGIHANPERIADFVDGFETDAHGYALHWQEK